jgi:carbonic anhydrase
MLPRRLGKVKAFPMSFPNAKRALLSIFACLTVGGISIQSASAQAKASAHEWSYEGAEGPAHWGDLTADYATCKLGRSQSPIDIRDARQESCRRSNSITDLLR